MTISKKFVVAILTGAILGLFLKSLIAGLILAASFACMADVSTTE